MQIETRFNFLFTFFFILSDKLPSTPDSAEPSLPGRERKYHQTIASHGQPIRFAGMFSKRLKLIKNSLSLCRSGFIRKKPKPSIQVMNAFIPCFMKFYHKADFILST